MLIKNYQTNINKTLNNTDISKDTNTILSFNWIKYPTSDLSVFDIYNNEDIVRLIEEQKKFVKKEADLYFKYGWLSKMSYEQTIKQYDNLFYLNGYFYLQSDIKEYIAKNIRISWSTEFDIYSEQIDTTKPTYEISRQAIRNITGYSPYFTPTLWEWPTTYVEWQDKLIEDEHKIVLVLWSRQIGKSFSIAEKAVEESHIPNNDILVWAFRVASTDNIRKYIRKFIKNFSDWYFEEFKAERYFLNTKTGSKIYFRTLSEENEAVEAVRWMTLNTIIVDEAQLVTEYAYEEILRPTLATTAWKMILIWTPPRTTTWYFVEKIFQYKKWLLPKASYYEIKLQDQPFTDPDTREEMMSRQDEPRIQREWFCNLTTESEQLFKPTISKQYPLQSDNNHFYTLTIDPARLWDRSWYTINQIWNWKVSTILSGFVPDSHKKDWTLQASFFKKIIQNYPNIIIWMDISWVWDWVYTIFKQAGLKIHYTIRYTSWQVMSVKQTEATNYTVAKSILINTFLDFISEDQLEIIELTNKDLIEELSYIQEDQTRTWIISFKSRFYDDITNALMINLFIIKERKLLSKTPNQQTTTLPSSNNELIDAIEWLWQYQQQYSSMW